MRHLIANTRVQRFLSTLLIGSIASAAAAEHRAALLIGNSAYPDAALATPARDVAGLAAAFSRRGFQVTVAENLNDKQMQQASEAFARSAPAGGTAVVYFSGYVLWGKQNEREDTVFLPVDGRANNAWEVARSRIGVAALAQLFKEKSSSRRLVVIADGGYRHPAQAEDSPTGLNPLAELPADAAAIFAAPPGEVIAPAESGNSPLASALIDHLDRADRGLGQALRAAAVHLQTADDFDFEPLDHPASPFVAPAAKMRPGRTAGDEWVNSAGMVFCWCPPEKFTMGTPSAGGAADGNAPADTSAGNDETAVEVELTQGFWLSKYELTRGQVTALVGRPPYLSEGTLPDQPITVLKPDQLTTTLLDPLNRAAQQAGEIPANWHYTLPSEAEWEYAARAGTRGERYFGDDAAQLARHANFADRALLNDPSGLYPYAHQHWDDGHRRLARVGSYEANPWGLHDMYGNVWELCRSGYEPQLAGGSDPAPPLSKTYGYAARGGGWTSPADYCRSAFRHYFPPDTASSHVGYRLILRPKQ